ncbi:Ras family GTPase [Catovirus CTV1]|uniref:Ras family GTPase n=1 Tax=Catovirus CTV1 TaxID=1977631 RepID=A0A1V0SAD1_9VIRU|nr:Ras family GTPase [Catovirus CTV1]
MVKECKVVIVGSSGVGKTSLLDRLRKNQFFEYTPSTIGSTYSVVKKDLGNGDYCDIKIWDTAGQERYRALVPLYLRNCDAILYVYNAFDHSNCETDFWMKFIGNEYDDKKKLPLLYLIGNKIDLLMNDSNEDMIKSDVESNLNVCIPVKDHQMVSAKTGKNVNELFDKMVKDLYCQNINNNIEQISDPCSIIIENNNYEEKGYISNYLGKWCGYF